MKFTFCNSLVTVCQNLQSGKWSGCTLLSNNIIAFDKRVILEFFDFQPASIALPEAEYPMIAFNRQVKYKGGSRFYVFQ